MRTDRRVQLGRKQSRDSRKSKPQVVKEIEELARKQSRDSRKELMDFDDDDRVAAEKQSRDSRKSLFATVTEQPQHRVGSNQEIVERL